MMIRRQWRRFIYWLFKKYYLSAPGVHCITCVNIRVTSAKKQQEGEKAIEKYNAINEAALDQLKATLKDIGAGRFVKVDDLYDE